MLAELRVDKRELQSCATAIVTRVALNLSSPALREPRDRPSEITVFPVSIRLCALTMRRLPNYPL